MSTIGMTHWMTRTGVTAGLILGAVVVAAEPLTLVQAVESALERYPSIQASLAQVELSQAALGESEAKRFPVVSIGANLSRYQKPTIVHPIHAFEPDLVPPFDRTLFQLLGDLQYTIFDGGGRRSRIDASRARTQSAQSSLVEARQRLIAEVVRAYLSSLGLQQTLEARGSSIAALELELSRVRQLFDVGRAAQIDLLRVEAAIASATADKVRTATSLEVAERSLARLTGAPIARTRASNLLPVSLTGKTLPGREELVEAALESNATVRQARDEVSIAEAGLGESESRRLPTVNLDGRYINYGSASGANSLEWNVGVSVSYPIFTGGSVGRAIARSRAAERSAVERVKWTEAEVTGQLDRGLAAVDESIARCDALEVAVSRYEEVARIEKLRLDTGAGTELDYIHAEADLLAARASLIESRYGEISARAELARMTGSLSVEWVSTHVRSEP